MPYAHLSQRERYQIQMLHRAGFLPSQIGRQLARHPTTIARELRRNRRHQDYQARHAQCLSLQRRQPVAPLAATQTATTAALRHAASAATLWRASHP
ncbi:MAG: helix-turn-helix domain-containing protein [Rhodanobacteraceae bacterium]